MQVCSFPAALCGSELAASNSHRTAEAISLGLPQFFKQDEIHHKFGKAEKISLEASAQFGKTEGGRNNSRYAQKAYTHILSFTVSSWGQTEQSFSVIFSKTDHTPPSSQLANFISFPHSAARNNWDINIKAAGWGQSKDRWWDVPSV